MATDVLMPQMGESIAEGTIVKWLKKVGDSVQRDEPLLEISTDKVDAEIPSPAAGTLTEILAREGDTVHVNSVIARLSEGAAGASGRGTSAASASSEVGASPAAGSNTGCGSRGSARSGPRRGEVTSLIPPRTEHCP
jgi:pyruvate dehydrogenase E2 component (dihydrolipoamide acetyltransferase)